MSPKERIRSVSTARLIQLRDSAILVGDTRISGLTITSPQWFVITILFALASSVKIEEEEEVVLLLLLLGLSVLSIPRSTTWIMSPLRISQDNLQKKHKK